MYIKKADRQLFEELDKHLTLPNNFSKFTDNIAKKHNLIIKYKEFYHCCNCDYDFQSIKKINETEKCPFCKNEYLVKSTKLQRHEFDDHVALLAKYQDKYVIRFFEIKTYFNNQKTFTDVCEYARKIYDNSFVESHEIVNDHIFSGIGTMCIRHDKELYAQNWRFLTSYWKIISDSVIVYRDNLISLFKGTKWQYSQLWVLAKKIEYLDISHLLRCYTSSVELLIKLGFYNLALEPSKYSKKGNFKDRFGINKEYIKFIKKNNLTSNELEALAYIQKKDLEMIKYFSNIKDFSDFKKYKIDLYKLKRITDFDMHKTHEYFDYLKFAEELKYDLTDKKILYPIDINEAHDRLSRLIKTKKSKEVSRKIKARYKNLSKNIYKSNKYIIFPAASVKEMIEESAQQVNCVKDYTERYSKGDCDIYFMRYAESKDKSLVTVEVRDNKVYQKRTRKNQNTTVDQDKFLTKWEQRILVGGK